jgi:hypothetical protein
MEEQARQLATAVAVFKVAGGNVATPANAVIAKPQAAAKPARELGNRGQPLLAAQS